MTLRSIVQLRVANALTTKPPSLSDYYYHYYYNYHYPKSIRSQNIKKLFRYKEIFLLNRLILLNIKLLIKDFNVQIRIYAHLKMNWSSQGIHTSNNSFSSASYFQGPHVKLLKLVPNPKLLYKGWTKYIQNIKQGDPKPGASSPGAKQFRRLHLRFRGKYSSGILKFLPDAL
jgi:hypothetical protein